MKKLEGAGVMDSTDEIFDLVVAKTERIIYKQKPSAKPDLEVYDLGYGYNKMWEQEEVID